MNEVKNRKEIFLRISVCLTGFSEMELLGTGMLENYFNVMVNKNSVSVVDSFLSESEKILQNNSDLKKLNEEIGNRLMPDSLFNGLAKNIITMWYMGSWMNDIISPQTYVQGLIWNAAQTHPPGAKQPGYGSWSTLPFTTI
jgi:hypothetical protein